MRSSQETCPSCAAPGGSPCKLRCTIAYDEVLEPAEPRESGWRLVDHLPWIVGVVAGLVVHVQIHLFTPGWDHFGLGALLRKAGMISALLAGIVAFLLMLYRPRKN